MNWDDVAEFEELLHHVEFSTAGVLTQYKYLEY